MAASLDKLDYFSEGAAICIVNDDDDMLSSVLGKMSSLNANSNR